MTDFGNQHKPRRRYNKGRGLGPSGSDGRTSQAQWDGTDGEHFSNRGKRGKQGRSRGRAHGSRSAQRPPAAAFDFDFAALHRDYQKYYRPEDAQDDEEGATDATIEQWYADPYDRVWPDQATNSVLGYQNLVAHWYDHGVRNVNQRDERYVRLKHIKHPERKAERCSYHTTPECKSGSPSQSPALETIEDDVRIDGLSEEEDVSEEDGDEQQTADMSSTGRYHGSPGPIADPGVGQKSSSKNATLFEASWPFTDDDYADLSVDQKLEVLHHRLDWIERVHADSRRLSERPSDVVDFEFDPSYWGRGIGGLATQLRTANLRTRYGEHNVHRHRRYFTQGHKPLQKAIVSKDSTLVTRNRQIGKTRTIEAVRRSQRSSSDELSSEESPPLVVADPFPLQAQHVAFGDETGKKYFEVLTEDPTFGITSYQTLNFNDQTEDEDDNHSAHDLMTTPLGDNFDEAVADEVGLPDVISDDTDSDTNVSFMFESRAKKMINVKKLTKKQKEELEQTPEQKQRALIQKLNAKIALRIGRLRQLQAEAHYRIHAAQLYELLARPKIDEGEVRRSVADLSQEDLEFRLHNSRRKLQRLRQHKATVTEKLRNMFPKHDRRQSPGFGESSHAGRRVEKDHGVAIEPATTNNTDVSVPSIEADAVPAPTVRGPTPATEVRKDKGKRRADSPLVQVEPSPKRSRTEEDSAPSPRNTSEVVVDEESASTDSYVRWIPPENRSKKFMAKHPQPDDLVPFGNGKIPRAQLEREKQKDDDRRSAWQQQILSQRLSKEEVEYYCKQGFEGKYKTWPRPW